MCAQIKSKKNHTLFPKKKKHGLSGLTRTAKSALIIVCRAPEFDSVNFKVHFCNCIRDRPAIWGWARTNLIYRSQASYPPCMKPQLMKH